MSNHSKFQRGSGCYACEICTRQTRNTGDQAMGSKLCPECWEAAGNENEFQDGYITEEELRAKLVKLRDYVVSKGGNAQSFADSMMVSLPPYNPSAAASAQTTDEVTVMKTYTNKSNAARAAKSANGGSLNGLELKGKEGAWYYTDAAKAVSGADLDMRAGAKGTKAPAKKAAKKAVPAKAAKKAAKAVQKRPYPKHAHSVKERKVRADARSVGVEYDVRNGPTQGRIVGYHIDEDRETKHGVKRRSSGTIGGRLWAIFDKMAAKAGGAAKLEIGVVKESPLVDGFNANKVLIEFYVWRKFNGVRGRGKKQKVA
jgi:hypothetical protein